MASSNNQHGQPPWLPLSIAIFAFVQACFGIAVGAGWKPWESKEPTRSEGAKAGTQPSRTADAPIIQHLLLSLSNSPRTPTEGMCRNAARAALSKMGFGNISEHEETSSVYGSREGVGVQTYCNKVPDSRIDIVSGYLPEQQELGHKYTIEFAQHFDDAIRR